MTMVREAATAPVQGTERMDVLDAIFYGIGLGLWAKVPLAIVMAGAFGLFIVRVVLSRVWLTYAAFGPVEWLWRMFTYRRRVSLWRAA